VTEFTARFLFSEWTYVVDAWQLDSSEGYGNVPRLGRKTAWAPSRERCFGRCSLRPEIRSTDEGVRTWAQIFGEVAAYYSNRQHKSFNRIVVDEAQDLGVAELRLLATIVSAEPNGFFSNRFPGPRLAWTCGADRRPSRSIIEPRIRFARALIDSCRESSVMLTALRRRDLALFQSSMDRIQSSRFTVRDLDCRRRASPGPEAADSPRKLIVDYVVVSMASVLQLGGLEPPTS
jgi:hypothetical protein